MTLDSLNHEFLASHDFLSSLGISIVDETPGEILIDLPHRPALTNPGTDVMQGGIVATVVDHAAGAALRTTFESRPIPLHATTDLSVSYLKPAKSDLRATGTVLRAGGTMGVVRTTVENSDSDLIAEGRVSLAIKRDQVMPGTE